LRRATFLPVESQNCGSSGRQSSIHLPDLPDGGCGGAVTVFCAIGVCVNCGGAAMAITVATRRFPGVALRMFLRSVSLTAADPLW
jgi:hypothetical protein